MKIRLKTRFGLPEALSPQSDTARPSKRSGARLPTRPEGFKGSVFAWHPGVGSRLSLWLLFVATAGLLQADTATVWIGTSTSAASESQGIYRATLDLESGDLSRPVLAAEIASPGFLALHPNGKRLYSVCRLPDGEGGGVAAFEIAGNPPSLTLLNTQPIRDGGAAHLALDRSGRCLFTAQYGAGSVAAFPLDANGRLKPRSTLVRHEGSGPNPDRQEAPHPHWVGTDPQNGYLFVPDLGIDQVVIYRLNDNDRELCDLTPHGTADLPAGSGPRHMKFHPSESLAYVLNELELSVTAFEYDSEAGTLSALQTISTLPEEMRETPNKASEIRIHPNGRFLYTANRGHDSIAVFAIDPETGRLTFIEHEAIRGSWPRNFNIDPTGRWLLAAGRHSNTLSVFRIDPETGGLVYSGTIVSSPTPICIEIQHRD